MFHLPYKSKQIIMRADGFTLIELSIVLIIIGLITGGILVGSDLIRASEVRATIAQVEQFNAAVNTFKEKYNDSLPGDMDADSASKFGFAARGTARGQGDGNGVIEGQGSCGCYGLYWGMLQGEGEAVMFWSDLTYANGQNLGLISGTFNKASSTAAFPAGTTIDNIYPAAKLGHGNYFYVWSGGYYQNDGFNYFGLSAITQVPYAYLSSSPGLTVQQAYSIDVKIDDGLPQAGSVKALYLDGFPAWSGGATGQGEGGAYPTNGALPLQPATGQSYTCYDNGGNASAAMSYSLSQKGKNLNCALSFRFQ